MAKSNFKKMTSIKDTEGGNFGNYKENNGGGTPRGGVWGGKNGRVGWDEREKSGELPQNAHRKEQPRTNDGKFTYNSVNGKETKYESRGETVNPLLTGGENGVYIEDVDKRGKTHDGVKSQFANKKGDLYDKYKDKWYQKDSKLITKEGRKYKVKLSANDIWEIARVSFDVKKGSFTYEDENFNKSKAGRRSRDDKTAMQNARKDNAEQFVKSNSGGIAQISNAQPGQKLSTGVPFTINPSVIANFRKKQQILANAGLQPTQSAFNGNSNNAGGLKPGQKFAFTINPNVVANIGNLAAKHLAVSVPQSAPAAKPKAGALAGFFNKKK